MIKHSVSFNNSNGLNVGNYNHLSIAKEIFNLKLEHVLNNKKGKNRISIEFKNYNAANNFISNQSLITKGYEMLVPANNVSSKGIIRYVDKIITEEELLNYTECKNANIKITEVRRLKRKINDNNIKYIPTGTVCFTFSGKTLPKENLVPKAGHTIHSPPLFKSTEFPPLPTNETDIIPVNQRRYNLFSLGNPPGPLRYSTAAQKTPTKKRKVSSPIPYNKKPT
ncbi:hypothetical protein NQ315_015912 [Exocentrus adspersus]|uniref:GIY-YIG homing endonuclease n=1 Tax=Exocentrus adspersus TaxID=1586481 RepID=A0AAV8V8D3_9CUCU|nr:hypothetical protein NQ315_015912 [Exocentrus adspersus]